jgi:hypothetical protein
MRSWHLFVRRVGGVALLAGGVCRGQADFAESFDSLGTFVAGQVGPQTLINRGWIFRNQSSPPGDYAWRGGPYTFNPCGYSTFQPQAGAGYLGADGRSVSSTGGYISDWAILPAIPGQQSGDTITLWARSGTRSAGAVLEVRYSPGGGTSTGSTHTDIGDFTTLLLSIAPPPSIAWGRYATTVPGSGRLALRYVTPSFAAQCDQLIGIDSLTVGPPSTPCAGFPPIPLPNETATWDAGGSPYHICSDTLIPAGATVFIEPGVVVNIDPGRSLVVEGTLTGSGTPEAPIRFEGGSNSARILVYGTLDLSRGALNCRVTPQGGGSILLRDCVFQGPGVMLSTLGQQAHLWAQPAFVSLERCTYMGTGAGWELLLERSHIRLKDVHVRGAALNIQDSYVWLDGVSLDGGPLELWFVNVLGHQDVYVDNVAVRNFGGNSLSQGALSLRSADFFLGPGNILENNLYPVGLAGGLIPGSRVPATGNTNNRVLAENTSQYWRNPSVWGNPGVPYECMPGGGEELRVEPGTTVLLRENASLTSRRLVAEGLPEAPITFAPMDPARPWDALISTYLGLSPRLEHCVVEGAQRGVRAFGATVHMNNCVLRNNRRGATAAFYGILRARKCRFLDNEAGAYCEINGSLFLNLADNPNAFTGNAAGVFVESGGSAVLTHNWWGSPAGPRHPANPGGLGDPIVYNGAPATVFTPYLASAPDFVDTAPVVRIRSEPYRPNVRRPPLLETGSRYIVEWDARDDGAIVLQRVLFSESGNFEQPANSAGFVEVATLAPEVRRYEWTVPDVPQSATGLPAFLRVVAVDDAGQEGFDEFPILIPAFPATTSIVFGDIAGRTYRAGQALPRVSPDPLPSSARVFVLLDADEDCLDAGAGVTVTAPYASTDLARIGVVLESTANNLSWHFSDYFAIRPDPRIGDAPPLISLLAPANGQAFEGCGVVPIAWSASDDEGLRSFAIQASFDAGRTWHTLVRDLPGSAREYLWALPPGGGIPEARVRVIARDVRFQNSSATRAISILARTDCAPTCDPDVNCDGSADGFDMEVMEQAVAGDLANFCRADPDFNRDGSVDGFDVEALESVVGGGQCP